MEKKKVVKIAVSLLTIGVTATVAYYGIKAIKKNIAKKKAIKELAQKAEEKAAVEAEAKTKEVPAEVKV